MPALPPRRRVQTRVACALDTGLDGAERPEVERWLGGYRRLDPLIVPAGGAAPVCSICAGDLEPAARGWRCPVCEPAP